MEIQKKSFRELYDDAKEQPTPAQAFINEVCAITKRKEQTVKMWLSGAQTPDLKTIRIIADHFKCSVIDLFPE